MTHNLHMQKKLKFRGQSVQNRPIELKQLSRPPANAIGMFFGKLILQPVHGSTRLQGNSHTPETTDMGFHYVTCLKRVLLTESIGRKGSLQAVFSVCVTGRRNDFT